MSKRIGFSRLILLCLILPQWLAHAADVAVSASRQGDTFHVEASAELDADERLIWQVLTDYDRLPEFIPGLISSRVVARHNNSVVIDQKGATRLLFFTFPIEVRLAAEEIPYKTITSHAVAGNFKEMRNAYHLEPGAERVRLRYTGSLTPDFSVPPLIGTLTVRRNVERQFSAMVDEIVRRGKQHARPAPVDGQSRGEREHER